MSSTTLRGQPALAGDSTQPGPRLRVGLFAIGLEAYWSQFEGLRKQLDDYAAQLDALYARARIFAFPSLDEGFGMPILEAMARGVPVITSSCSAMPEVAGDAALLIDPLRVDDLSSALLRLAADESLRDEMTRRGRARARGYTWDSAVAQTWAVYDKVISG